jgi:hypothetical protein
VYSRFDQRRCDLSLFCRSRRCPRRLIRPVRSAWVCCTQDRHTRAPGSPDTLVRPNSSAVGLNLGSQLSPSLVKFPSHILVPLIVTESVCIQEGDVECPGRQPLHDIPGVLASQDILVPLATNKPINSFQSSMPNSSNIVVKL